MKQYTTPEQTAKLIELGFEKPKNERWVLDVANESTPSIQNVVKRQDYSIGELIEMLPTLAKIKGYDYYLYIESNFYDGSWDVGYMRHDLGLSQIATELIDALYAMILQLKGEGVI